MPLRFVRRCISSAQSSSFVFAARSVDISAEHIQFWSTLIKTSLCQDESLGVVMWRIASGKAVVLPNRARTLNSSPPVSLTALVCKGPRCDKCVIALHGKAGNPAGVCEQKSQGM